MNRTTKLKKKSSPAPNANLKSQKDSTSSHRNPLKDLNITRSNTKTCSISTNSNTSSASIEPPKGCLGFLRPNYVSKIPSKRFIQTPKSAPISKPRSKPPISHKTQTPNFLNKSENDKDCSFRDLKYTLLQDVGRFGSESKRNHQWPFARSTDEDKDEDGCTPMVDKLGLGFGSVLDGKEETTPPVEASISPEIQCGSSFISDKSACFGAGHILSGVTDKRKCRPRGVLAVEGGNELRLFKDGSSVDDDGFLGFFDDSRASLVPAPIEASMHWLSPPCKEENDRRESIQNGGTPFNSPSSALHKHGFASYTSGDSTCDTTSTTRGTGFVTPTAQLNFEALLGSEDMMSKGENEYRFELSPGKISPNNGKDSLGSGNVICTPRSDSSLDDGSSWYNHAKGSMFEYDYSSNFYSTPSLSPKKQTSFYDPADVLPLPGFSFQFTHHNTQPSHSRDRDPLQKTSSDPQLGFSGSSFGNSSQSQIRISWRDGLVSRILEMDDLDCCRLLSDEEDDISGKADKNAVQDPILINNVMPDELVSKIPEVNEHFDVQILEDSKSCAESISTDGGELTNSRDSDWNQCYKNHLFIE
ncbi:hypothetical protein ACHQM5_010996 [Ranunculus cassubicifolius]